MIRAYCHSYHMKLLACVFLLLGLCGCSYQAQLLDHQQIEPGGGVAVQCKVVRKPVIKVSESGDFVFWAGGPGPLTWSIAQIINEGNNSRYRKMLKPALEGDYLCDGFEANLEEAVEEIGLQLECIDVEHKKAGIPLLSKINDIDIFGLLPDEDRCQYVLRLEISYGLFKSDARSVGQIEGWLVRVSDNKVIWKNKLRFEGQAGAEHKAFGDGKKAVKEWAKDHDALRNCLREVVAGVTELLAKEFCGTTCREQQLAKLKLKDGSRIKGSVLDESGQRVVVRLKGGAVRSLPVDKVVSMK